METKHIIAIAIAIAVGAITMSTVLVPAVSMGTDTEDTFTNTGYYRMQKITADDTNVYTIIWDKTTDIFTLNGVEVDIGDHSQYGGDLGLSVVMTDNSVSRYVTNLRVQSWGTSFAGSIGYSSSTMKIILNNGTETITADEGTADEVTKTISYNYAYFASNTGDYIMKDKVKPAYVNADSEVCAVGVTKLNTSTTPLLSVLTMTGDASSVEFNAIVGGTTATFDDIVITAPAVSGYEDLYNLEKVTGVATYDGAETNLIYSYFAVPYEVTAEKSVHASAPVIQIFNMLPIFVALGLIVMVIGVAYAKYRR